MLDFLPKFFTSVLVSNAVVCMLKDIIIHKQEIIGHCGLVRSSAVEGGDPIFNLVINLCFGN